MRAEVHVGEVDPGEERLAGLDLLLDELRSTGGDVVVIVSIRFFVSGPVSSICCVPTGLAKL